MTHNPKAIEAAAKAYCSQDPGFSEANPFTQDDINVEIGWLCGPIPLR